MRKLNRWTGVNNDADAAARTFASLLTECTCFFVNTSFMEMNLLPHLTVAHGGEFSEFDLSV